MELTPGARGPTRTEGRAGQLAPVGADQLIGYY